MVLLIATALAKFLLSTATRTRMTVEILIPCLNEAPCIAQLVRQIQGVLPSAVVWVCDNGSTDDTAARARQAGARVLVEPKRGKGNAVRALFQAANADVCVLIDGDLTYDVQSLPALVRQFETDKLDLLNVSRQAIDKNCYPCGRALANKILNFITRYVGGVKLSDVLSGYKLFSKRFIKSHTVVSSGFEVEMELVLTAYQLKMNIAETFAPYYARRNNNPSKLRLLKDGWHIFIQFIKMKFHQAGYVCK